MKKIALLSILLVLCLTACEEKEPDKDNPVIDNNSDSNVDNEEDDVEENTQGNSGIIVEDNSDEDIPDEEKTQEKVYAVPYAESLSPYFSYHVENGEVKPIEYSNSVSGVCSLKGIEYPFAFEWERVGDKIRTMSMELPSGMVRPEVWYSDVIIAVSKTTNIAIYHLITMDENNNVVFYYAYLDLDTGEVRPIGDEAFWNSHEVVSLYYDDSCERLMIVTKEEIFYFDGSTMKSISENLLSAGMKIAGGESIRISILENEAVISGTHKGTGEEKYLSACTYNLSTGEVRCTIDSWETSSIEQYSDSVRFDCLFATYCDGENLKIVNLATGQIRNVDGIKADAVKADEIMFCDGKYFIFMYEDGADNIFVAYNAYNGREIDRIRIVGERDSYEMFNVVHSDEGIYIKYSTATQTEIYRLNTETE